MVRYWKWGLEIKIKHAVQKEYTGFSVDKQQSFYIRLCDMLFVSISHTLCDECIWSLVYWWVISEGGSDICASRTSCTPAAYVQSCLQPMCSCQSDRHQPPALLMRSWRRLLPVLQARCDITKAKTKKQYFWKSLSWAVSAELCSVSSKAASWKSLSCFTEAWPANCHYRLLLFFFVTKRPWWQNKFSYGKLSELSDREQSFNWVLTPSLGFLMPPLFALDSAPSISIAFLLASFQVLRSQSGVFLDGWRMLQGASYPSQHQWLWSVSVAWSDKIWQPLCGSSLFVLAKKNIPSSRQSTEGGFNVFIVCLLVHIKE